MSPVVDSQLFPEIINTPLLGPGPAPLLFSPVYSTHHVFISQPRLTALIQGGSDVGDSHLFKL